MTGKKWHRVLVGVIIFILSFILLTGISQHGVSNLYVIPAGTFDVFSGTNGSMDLNSSGTSIAARDDSQNRKLMDAMVSIDEWNISSPNRYNRNITILHISDTDFNEYPELKRVMLDAKDDPPRNFSGQSLSVAYFPANLSDYYHWLLDSVCKDKARLECYDDFPVFEYHGRHYDIGVAFF